jgi:nickel superoxide dismutase
MFKMRNRVLIAVSGMAFLLMASTGLRGHCQIPCGIYDDPVRFQLLAEHIQTIEKSMNEIKKLSADPSGNANQLIRWVRNKDEHADMFATIITEYFLQQRIKPGETSDTGYVRKVMLCHRMLVTVMKAKQTIDLEHVKQLREDLASFRKAYMGKEEAHHGHEH